MNFDALWRNISGNTDFDEGEEYLSFRYHFFFAVLIAGVLLSSLYLWMHHSGLAPLAPAYHLSTSLHAMTSFVLILFIRGHKSRLTSTAWIYEIICMIEFVTALIAHTSDEARLIWLVINLTGVYIILGRVAGIAITVFTVVCTATVDAFLDLSFSPNTMATFYTTLIYNSIFFYAYSSRSFSFYLRLVDANARLKHMAERDPLTGLFNERTYYTLCDQMIEVSRRTGKPYSVLFIDLDHFKKVNDTFGHHAGDVVLKTVAACLQDSLRKSDIPGRIGGEEFSLFLPDTDLGGALETGEKLRRNIENLEISVDDRPIRITASIGVSENRSKSKTFSQVQKEADQAMYRAKAQGRNRVTGL